jgi:hypothetical protein
MSFGWLIVILLLVALIAWLVQVAHALPHGF